MSLTIGAQPHVVAQRTIARLVFNGAAIQDLVVRRLIDVAKAAIADGYPGVCVELTVPFKLERPDDFFSKTKVDGKFPKKHIQLLLGEAFRLHLTRALELEPEVDSVELSNLFEDTACITVTKRLIPLDKYPSDLNVKDIYLHLAERS